MKVTIHPRTTPSRLPHLVPPAYREGLAAVLEGAAPDAPWALLLFAHAPRDVVPSAPVRKALRRVAELPPGTTLLAVGTVFTAEALDLLAERRARIVAYRKAHWTDESARARQD
jgi:hypothetical protein